MALNKASEPHVGYVVIKWRPFDNKDGMDVSQSFCLLRLHRNHDFTLLLWLSINEFRPYKHNIFFIKSDTRRIFNMIN